MGVGNCFLLIFNLELYFVKTDCDVEAIQRTLSVSSINVPGQ